MFKGLIRIIAQQIREEEQDHPDHEMKEDLTPFIAEKIHIN